MKSIASAKVMRFFALILCLALLSAHALPFFAFESSHAEPSADEILDVARALIEYEKSANDCRGDFLIDGNIVSGAGNSSSDWLAFAVGRFGMGDDFAGYLAVAEDYICERYKKDEKLSAYKATEWHRLILSVLSCGGDPMQISDGDEKINLVADGIYARSSAAPLEKQGLNGLIWALIALDSRRYEPPENSAYTRAGIIEKILCAQLENGGFPSVGENVDVDITAMALTALAPYYHDETVYYYIQSSTGKTVSSTVQKAVDAALIRLCEMQEEGGDFSVYGTPNLESTCQVAVALCSLGIDLFSDERFIKNGNSIWDAILRYRAESGGFSHISGGTCDKLASVQALYTLAAIWRYKSGMRALFDLCDEMSDDMKSRIFALDQKLSDAESFSRDEISAAMREYYSLPSDTRRYVRNCDLLFDAVKEQGIDISEIKNSVTPISDRGAIPTKKAFSFSSSDAEKVQSLPDILTTEHYTAVTSLLYKLNASDHSHVSDDCREKLEKAKAHILEIKNEIAAINSAISLLPSPAELSRADFKAVKSLAARYESLSDYDKRLVSGYDSVEILLTRINTERRTVFITVGLIVSAAAISAILVFRIKRRLKKRERDLDELAAMYESEDDE